MVESESVPTQIFVRDSEEKPIPIRNFNTGENTMLTQKELG